MFTLIVPFGQIQFTLAIPFAASSVRDCPSAMKVYFIVCPFSTSSVCDYPSAMKPFSLRLSLSLLLLFLWLSSCQFVSIFVSVHLPLR